MSPPFYDEFQGPLVLRDPEQFHTILFIGGKATHLSDHVPHELAVLGEMPMAVAVPQLVHVVTLWPLLRLTGMGQWRAMAAVP